MPEVPGPGDGSPAHPRLPPTAGLDALKYRTAAEAALEPGSPTAHRVGWGFIGLYTLAYISTSLLFLAPLLVTLALKVNSLVGIDTGTGQPGACRRDRRPAGHVRQSVLRQDERPHLVAPGHAAALDGDRAGRRFPRHPHRRAGTQTSRWSSSAGASPSCSSTRCWPPRRRCFQTRSRPLNAAWSPVSWASVCLSRR